jgi:Zn-finger nucleic acid-binding protein
MEPMNFGGNSGITIDVCSQHGLWFDQGELEQVQAVHEFWQDKLKDPVFRQSITSKLKAEEAAVAEQASLQDVANHGFVGRLLKKIFS